MPGLTGTELEKLRDESEAWMPYTCKIYRSSESDDRFGGSEVTHSATPLYENVPCELESGTGHAQVVPFLARLETLQVFMVRFRSGVDVQVEDHLVIDGSEISPIHLEVRATLTPESLEIDLQVIATEVGEVVPHT